jgi:hypothetical protein
VTTGIEAAGPAPLVLVVRNAAPDGDRVDVHVTVTDVPARFASVSRSAAGEGGHAPMKRGLDRKTIGLMPSGAAN